MNAARLKIELEACRERLAELESQVREVITNLCADTYLSYQCRHGTMEVMRLVTAQDPTA